MNFKKNFCPSPWIHMRINNSGSYGYCRWQKRNSNVIQFVPKIQNQSPKDFFLNTMSDIRLQFLKGSIPDSCDPCVVMEQNNKISGRQRQRLKIGIDSSNFEKTLLSSPFKKDLDYSFTKNGQTTRDPVDWQIDLGNYCNSACVFCGPDSSSKLAQELHQLGLINSLPENSWCNDSSALKKFLDYISTIPNLRYLHFIGGETLITPAFKIILETLISNNLHTSVTIGFTTNLTVWKQDVINLLKQFKNVNLGVSIETLTELNNYVRYPSVIQDVKIVLDKWTALSLENKWYMQMRVTPTCLTIHELLTVFDYAWQHNLNTESCNFIADPVFMKLNVLPQNVRLEITNLFSDWVSNKKEFESDVIVNTRDPNQSKSQIIQDVKSYIAYLQQAPDEHYRFNELVHYLKKLESSRKNSILDYIPSYENIFRHWGY